ncbi:Mth938-like domain-containing protein [Oligella ureolytica]|uniref:Mth938-like domain-containing protein n=1 Tax=Oligella ureolytica TaxID=90244 RepID=A0A7T3BQC4_9BURK|nr:Mth938-like domain-containing protein [Oligella ureolytica]
MWYAQLLFINVSQLNSKIARKGDIVELQLQSSNTANTVTGYGDDYIEINETKYHQAIFFRPEGPVSTWDVKSIEDITLESLIQAAGLIEREVDPIAFLDGDHSGPSYENKPELVIIGTGKKQQFIPPSILHPLLANRIGIECMDTQAAARTYNVLMNENRQVVAALLVDGSE